MVCQSLVRDSLITRFNFVDPDRRVLTRLECNVHPLGICMKKFYCENIIFDKITAIRT